jgi:pyruvate dehydrogenase E2 component (dihydrolipoamide acetyltransferase)
MPNLHMPRLSDSMEEGTIIRWLKASGDHVEAGEEVVEIESDKATMPYEAEASGTLEILVAEGETVAVGAPIARIGDAADAPEPPAPVAPAVSNDGDVLSGRDAPAPAVGVGAANGDGRARVLATPVARRLARAGGIDLGGVEGTGPAGRIRKADVLAVLHPPTAATETVPAPAPVPAEATSPPSRAAGAEPAKGEAITEELSRLQVTVARRMAEARATVPDFTAEIDIDMSAATALRESLREAAGDDPVPSFNDFVLRACAMALRAHPRVNGTYSDGAFHLFPRVNVGLAVAAENALLVPVIRDTDRLALGEVAREARRLARAAREGSITPPDLAGGTFTVSNLGGMGVDRFTAVINPPQAAILAVGAIVERPVGVEGRVELRPMMTVRLSCDHRIIYGADAAAFLTTLRGLIEAPLRMAL